MFNILKDGRLLENLEGGHLFYKGWTLEKNLNVLGVDTYLIKVRKGAYLITLNWIAAYTKMTYYIRTSVVTCRVYCGFEAELFHMKM